MDKVDMAVSLVGGTVGPMKRDFVAHQLPLAGKLH